MINQKARNVEFSENKMKQIGKTIISVETGFIKIGLIDSRSIVKLLEVTSQLTLAKALKGAPDYICTKIFTNMSSRESIMLKEDMEWIGPVLKKDVLEAQKEVVQILEQFESSNQIVIPRIMDNDIVE